MSLSNVLQFVSLICFLTVLCTHVWIVSCDSCPRGSVINGWIAAVEDILIQVYRLHCVGVRELGLSACTWQLITSSLCSRFPRFPVSCELDIWTSSQWSVGYISTGTSFRISTRCCFVSANWTLNWRYEIVFVDHVWCLLLLTNIVTSTASCFLHAGDPLLGSSVVGRWWRRDNLPSSIYSSADVIYHRTSVYRPQVSEHSVGRIVGVIVVRRIWCFLC